MATPLKLENVQGDILLDGLPKKNETFFFFQIDDAHVKQFCQNLKAVAEEITPSTQTDAFRKQIANSQSGLVDLAGANIAFSMNGLNKMSGALKNLDLQINEREPLFQQGMKAGAAGDAGSLGDPFKPGSTTEPNWEPSFQQPENIHGLLLVAGSDESQVQQKLDKVKGLFGQDTVMEVTTIFGKVRPGAMKGHEHFGFDDGISQPAIDGIDKAPPGQDTIDPGVVLCNRKGSNTQPDWMTDGSFLCFRKLQQNVPDWNKFLVDASNQLGTWSDQLGARLIGRWKSGCPVTLSPDFDNTGIANDPNQNNNFDFDSGSNFKCPLGAHIRKTNPRSDTGRGPGSFTNTTRILRRGIPYGEELDVAPQGERGLLFVCYQSSIAGGFAFLQRTWANNPNFLTGGVGLDAVLGQTSDANATINMTGLFPQDPSRPLPMSGVNKFVVPKGGEYFFSPSMSALSGVLADVK